MVPGSAWKPEQAAQRGTGVTSSPPSKSSGHRKERGVQRMHFRHSEMIATKEVCVRAGANATQIKD